MKDLQKKIKRQKEKKLLGRYFISVNGVEKHVDGFVLDESRLFILLRECIDFEIKGLVVLEKKNITQIRYSKYDAAFTKIMKAEKMIEKIFSFENVSLSNHPSILKSIQKKYKYAIVENIYDGIIDFCIGEITRVNKKTVSVLYFDVTGLLDKTPTKIPYDEIITIEFESSYINTFRKYLRK